jgi:hypothetical protein
MGASDVPDVALLMHMCCRARGPGAEVLVWCTACARMATVQPVK